MNTNMNNNMIMPALADPIVNDTTSEKPWSATMTSEKPWSATMTSEKPWSETTIMKKTKGKKEVNSNGGCIGFKKTKCELCSVCCESYSMISRKKIECPKCEYKCCKKCIEMYLLASPKNTPNCMNCNLEFSSAFMFEKTSRVFVLERYMEKKAIHVLNEQKNLLPTTLMQITRKKEVEKRKEEIKKELMALKEKAGVLILELEHLNTFIDSNDTTDDEKCQRPCPVGECKGYLSSALKCYVCDVYVCVDCGNVKGSRLDDNHSCNEDDKKTLELLKKDTKPCPGCFKYIYKTEGCDQMFCVQCHTVFSWNTGKKLNGVTCHNPHYYEYQRSQNGGVAPRVAGDNLCDDYYENLPRWNQLVNRLPVLSAGEFEYKKLLDIYRSIIHNDDYVIRTTSNKLNEIHKSTLYLKFREKYLNSSDESKYSEENWLSNLKSDIKMCEKYKQMKMIYDLTRTILIEVFVKIFNGIDINSCMEEFENIIKYSNSQLSEIYKNYSTKVYMYNVNYILE